jgi:hypothetical protein
MPSVVKLSVAFAIIACSNAFRLEPETTLEKRKGGKKKGSHKTGYKTKTKKTKKKSHYYASEKIEVDHNDELIEVEWPAKPPAEAYPPKVLPPKVLPPKGIHAPEVDHNNELIQVERPVKPPAEANPPKGHAGDQSELAELLAQALKTDVKWYSGEEQQKAALLSVDFPAEESIAFSAFESIGILALLIL